MKYPSIAIVGPTASGKTSRAVDVAKHFNGEIISADSRQVYKDMTLGTGKDLEEYEGIPYHLIDIVEAGEKYNLHRFVSDFRAAKEEIESRDKNVVICGGSGLYVETALSGVILPEVPCNEALREELAGKSLDELTSILSSMKKLHNVTDVDSCKRAIRAIEIEQYYLDNPKLSVQADRSKVTPIDCVVIGVDIDRETRRSRISKRLRTRLEAGMIDEVRALLSKGIAPEDLIYYGLEYKFITEHLIGYYSFEEMVKRLEIAIHQFAKRQMTWFRGMERRGLKINWLPYDLSREEFVLKIDELLH